MIPVCRITWFLNFWWLQTWDSWPVPLRHRLRPIQNLKGVRSNRVKKSKKQCKALKLDESFWVHGNHHVCCSCLRLLKKNEMPPICFKNKLDYMDNPYCLKLNNLEKQLIVKSLLFMKVRQLPKTRMEAVNDRIINIPIEDGDLIKKVISLARTKKLVVWLL